MEYRKFDNTIVMRVQIGEDIVEKILDIAKIEQVKLATISGLGASNDIIIGFFDTENNEYIAEKYRGDHEILSIIGNLTTKNCNPYLHLHIACVDERGRFVGGHLNKAIVSATAEIFITILNGTVERVVDKNNGLNLLSF